MKRKWIIISTIIAIILIGGILAGPIMSKVEVPNYDIIRAEQNIEIRHYAPMIIAKVKVEGNREKAIANGFRLLADYIFGNNMVQKKIPMTAPVQQQESTKIAMTAPVQQQAEGGSWQVSFVMPSEYSINTIPKPNNKLVTLQEIPSKQFVVIQFTGTNSDKNVKEYENYLIKYVDENGITITGSPKYAFYNPPWTLPSMRHNEVMFEIK